MIPRLVLALILAARLAASDAPGPDVAFLAADEARAAIVDESIEPYFARLQPLEMAAKTGAEVAGDDLAARRAACRRRYADAVGEFPPAERDAIVALVGAADAGLRAGYPRFAAEPWRFLKVDRAIEGGLPHTRGGCIVLSDEALPMLAAAPDRNLSGVMLLVHEQCHVVQRRHPTWFTPLYAAWGFVRLPAEPAPTAGLLRRHLLNPDGSDCVWAFPVGERLVQPQLLIGGDAAVPRMPDDFQQVALDVEVRGGGFAYRLGADGEPASAPLAEVPGYAAAFAPSDEIFHPNEIAASLFSLMLVRDLAHLADGRDEPAVATLRTWAEATLRAPAAVGGGPAR